MKTKIFTLFLALAANVGIIFAESGTCGTDLTWDLTDSVLTIRGTGDMSSFFTNIPWYSYRSSIKTVIIGDSVTSIGRNAFSYCINLTSITIPNSVTSIEDSTFGYCIHLTSIELPNSIKSIGDHAFAECKSLTSPVYNTHVFAYMPTNFSGAYSIPDSIESIAGGAFYDCTGLTSIEIPNSVISIGLGAFAYCSGLTSVLISDLTAWCNISFAGGYDTNPLYNAHNLYLSNECITNLVIPDKVTSISDYAFYYCTGLTSVTIPNSVTNIGRNTFNGCSNLTSVTCMATVPPLLNYDVFYGVSTSIPLYVPVGSVNSYKTTDQWKNFKNILPITAKEAETNTVKAEPTNNSVEVTWPVVSGAYSYELVIRDKDGNVVCTLVFNEQGQLLSIAFHAPGRNAPQQTQSTGFAFTITGLEEGTSYDATIIAKDGEDNTLDTSVVSFTTKGDTPTAIDQITNDQSQMTNKILRDGNVYILRGDKTYTLTGAEVK